MLSDLEAKVDSLSTKGDLIVSNQTANQGVIMAVLDDLEAKVTSVQGVEESAAALLKALHDELTAAVANDDPARIQAVIDKLGSDSDKLAAAVTANPDPNAAATPPGL
jgi:hypothetical protein